MGFPEFQVSIPPYWGHPPQNDIWVIAKTPSELVSIAVEAKETEPFDKYVRDWNNSSGKETRLQYLCKKLNLEKDKLQDVRYQLLHRTASAIIMAEKFNAKNAIMLVHSFDKNNTGFEDYRNFTELFDAEAEIGTLVESNYSKGIHLYFGWAKAGQTKL